MAYTTWQGWIDLIANYGYDQDGLMTSASGMTMSRSPLNGLLQGTTLSNISDTYTYNSFGEVSTYTATGYQAQYTRDSLGRITAKTEQVLTETNNYAYSYDPAGRLVQVRKNGDLVSDYEYDLNSNRTRFNSTLGQYDGQDRMLNYGGFVYSYNQNGDLTGKLNSQTNESTAYSYDEFGNLKSVTLPNSTVITYLTDAQHRRVGKRINNTLVQSFIYQDQLNPIAELDGSGSVVSTFVYAAKSNVPDIMYKNGNTYRIISDQLGSPRLVINVANNQVIQQIEYDEFGQILSDSNPGFQPFGFAGGIYDQHTKLTRFGARDYDAFAGRWTSKDPILFNGGDTNLYGYVINDPINLVDPSGLCPWCVAAAVGAVVSGGIDLGTQLATNGGDLNGVNWGSVGTSALTGAAISTLGPTGALLGRGGQRAAAFGYNRSAGLLNSGAARLGWSGPIGGRDVLSLRTGATHLDLGWLGSARSGANALRDGFFSGILGTGATTGGVCE